MKRVNLIAVLLLMIIAGCSLTMEAATMQIGKVSIDNIGMNKRLLRLGDNGLMLGHSGMCVEVTVNFRLDDMAGERVVCEVAALSADGDYLQDATGDAAAVEAITALSDSYVGKVVVPLPYSWVINADSKRTETIRLKVTLATFGEDGMLEQKDVILSGSEINIDSRNLGNKLAGDLLGGGSAGGGLAGAILGSLFDTSDGETTQDCPSCEGSGICPHCDGDGFFVANYCRKCVNDPGICRRCKGEGTVTYKIDLY